MSNKNINVSVGDKYKIGRNEICITGIKRNKQNIKVAEYTYTKDTHLSDESMTFGSLRRLISKGNMEKIED